jgi:uncharacterized protein
VAYLLPNRCLLRVTTLVALAVAGCAEADADIPSGTPSPQEPSPPAGHAWVIFGTDTVTAELAETPGAQSQGLKNRQHLAPNTGMLFVFQSEAIRSFWMQDTLIPLDISFLDGTFTVVDIQQMEPLSERHHESARPAMFALEVEQGYHEARGIRIGDRARVVFGRR